MKRMSMLLAACALIALPATGCKKKDKSKNPDEAAESEQDPLEELKSIQGQIQAEVDTVMQPITDVDVVIDQVTTMPSRLGVDGPQLMALAKASIDSDGGVAVEIDVSADGKAEIEALLKTISGIGVGLKETPQRAVTASKNIVALGAKAAALTTKLTAKYNAKLSNPLAKADEKAKVQAELDMVVSLNGEIKGTVNDAKAQVMAIPAKGTEALAKLTKAFAGGAGTGGDEAEPAEGGEEEAKPAEG